MSATLDVLKTLCKQKQLYLTPHLNDVLYCNFQGFAELGGLEEYINLKSLFLEGNVVRDLRSLPPLRHLKSLCVPISVPILPFSARAVCLLQILRSQSSSYL
jgi:hypothetical protein